jgi:hypothetical protein
MVVVVMVVVMVVQVLLTLRLHPSPSPPVWRAHRRGGERLKLKCARRHATPGDAHVVVDLLCIHHVVGSHAQASSAATVGGFGQWGQPNAGELRLRLRLQLPGGRRARKRRVQPTGVVGIVL